MGLLSIKELSEYLSIKQKTLYSWTAQGKIPFVKIHGLIRFQKEEIDTWIEGFRKKGLKVSPINLPGNGNKNLDFLIAMAKRNVYNTTYGKTKPKSAPRKEDGHGAI